MFTINVALKREKNIIHLTYKDIIMIKKEMIYRINHEKHEKHEIIFL